jgi:hypothetical protein
VAGVLTLVLFCWQVAFVWFVFPYLRKKGRILRKWRLLWKGRDLAMASEHGDRKRWRKSSNVQIKLGERYTAKRTVKFITDTALVQWSVKA